MAKDISEKSVGKAYAAQLRRVSGVLNDETV